MGSGYFTPVTLTLFGLCAMMWLIALGWAGQRWLARRWGWPWPVVALVQGVLAAQIIYWLLGWMMALNPYFPERLLPWLRPLGGALFVLAVLPWAVWSNLLPLYYLAARLRLPFPDMLDAMMGYGLFYAALHIFGPLVYWVRRKVLS